MLLRKSWQTLRRFGSNFTPELITSAAGSVVVSCAVWGAVSWIVGMWEILTFLQFELF